VGLVRFGKGRVGEEVVCVCVEVGFGGEWGLFEKCYLYCYIDTRFCSDVGHRGGGGGDVVLVGSGRGRPAP